MTTSELGNPSTIETDPVPPRSARPLLMRMHFYAGVLVGPFLLIVAVTGGLYALAPTIEKFVYSDYLQVPVSEHTTSMTDQVAAAMRERPDLTLDAVRPAYEPGETTKVLFTDPSLGESDRLAVFVDPATARPVGESVVYGSSMALPFRTWLSGLHRNLHLGEPGRLYSELAASWLWVVALGGLILWVDRFRRTRRGGRAVRLFRVDRSGGGRLRTLNWHGVTGIWIVGGLMFLAATGLTWSKYAGENVSELRTALHWTTPSVSAGSSGHGHGDHGMAEQSAGSSQNSTAGLDNVVRVVEDFGLDDAVEIGVPGLSRGAFVVSEVRGPWVLSTDSIVVDRAGAQVTEVQRFADWPLAARLTAWGISLHMGILFGIWSQVLLALLAVALVSVIVRGYVMWWRRRPTRSAGWGRPPRRGAIWRLPPVGGVVVAASAVAVGWFLPVLGFSLLGFLLVDAMWSIASRRLDRRTFAAPE